MDPLLAAIRANPFMTGDVPAHIYAPPNIGELRSYLPPEARVTTLAILLYAAGVTPWSWAREPDWLIAATPEETLEIVLDNTARAVYADTQKTLGLLDALMDAEVMARESGKRLYDPTTMTPLFPDEETLH